MTGSSLAHGNLLCGIGLLTVSCWLLAIGCWLLAVLAVALHILRLEQEAAQYAADLEPDISDSHIVQCLENGAGVVQLLVLVLGVVADDHLMAQFHILQTFARHTIDAENLQTSFYLLFDHSLVDTRRHTIVMAEDEGMIQTVWITSA